MCVFAPGSCYEKYPAISTALLAGYFFVLPIFVEYNGGMTSLDYNQCSWAKPCPKVRCKKPAEGLKYFSVPASLGDDSPSSAVAPKNGEYANAIVKYEANGAVYIYSAEGVPVNVKVGQ